MSSAERRPTKIALSALQGGEGGTRRASGGRVRWAATSARITPPHPNPLPPKGAEREKSWVFSGFSRHAALSGLLLLGACGFSPLYEAHDQLTDPVLASVAVDQVSDHLGVVLTNHLRDGFNPGGEAAAAYQLHVDLDEEAIGLAYRNDGTIAQTQLNLTGAWTLRRLSDRKIVGKGSSLGTTFYDDMPDAYANTAAKESGEMRAVEQLADDIHARIALLLKDAPPAS